MRSQLTQPCDGRDLIVPWDMACWKLTIVLVLLSLVPAGFAQDRGSVSGVRTIYIGSVGDGPAGTTLRRHIVDHLTRSGRLKVVEDPLAADTTLQGTSSIWSTGSVLISSRSRSFRQTNYEGYLSVDLVDKTNHPLWSYLVTPSRFRYGSISDNLARQMVAHLLARLHGNANDPASPSDISSPMRTSLHAGGSTLSAPLYLKWFESSGMNVKYDVIGSEAGIEQLDAGRVDFAASDMPLGDATISSHRGVTHIPTVVGGVVPIYNLPGLGLDLRLTPEVLAGIYSGAIRRWNDSRIREANHGAHLPNLPIAVVHRSDGSGTTYVWTSFLSQVSPDWKNSVGAGTHVEWPVGSDAPGNDGVAKLVQQTPDSIGYVELIFAIQHQLAYAEVRNPAGQFIKADLSSITAAATGAAKLLDADLRVSILNTRNKAAYPISTFTWLLIPTEGLEPQKKAAIRDLLKWILTSGQKKCASMGYAPLPHDVDVRALQVVEALH